MSPNIFPAPLSLTSASGPLIIYILVCLMVSTFPWWSLHFSSFFFSLLLVSHFSLRTCSFSFILLPRGWILLSVCLFGSWPAGLIVWNPFLSCSIKLLMFLLMEGSLGFVHSDPKVTVVWTRISLTVSFHDHTLLFSSDNCWLTVHNLQQCPGYKWLPRLIQLDQSSLKG